MTTTFAARTPRGLEWVTADEVDAISGRDIGPDRRSVRFSLDGPLSAVLDLRTVDDVFVAVGTVDGVGTDTGAPARLAAGVSRLPVGAAVDVVAGIRDLPPTPVLDVVASVEGTHRFNRYAVEDAVGPLLASPLRASYASRRDSRPPPSQLTVRIVVHDETAEVMVRVGARPQHRRSWKVATGAATLHPPAAAALIRLAGPAGRLIDPCCGDGTVPIEAALTGRSALGADLDPIRVANARRNASAAGVPVPFAVADASRAPWRPHRTGTWVTNPPWNRNVAPGGGADPTLLPLWRQAAEVLGDDDRLVVLADAEVGVADGLGHAGLAVGTTQDVRLAGRLCTVVVAALHGSNAGLPSERLGAWRNQARRLGVVSGSGF